ncbi:UDP-3-O-(3-hydroxymyristoyl)glucosamine N-acyltransferase [Marinobacterium aestuarii]|uniref:UDP-3-O-(3-hydroxymyristoyl)glucosamine N-acyltransferase n=1 Tax=Marinobacterium aestuarii TaxID=1821621 RepID=UPI0009FCDF73|nr:UDP-3-O-(3-hydroxymyristoyl)glucosamine N-acyltransferase [Marinobacterium aestuarii]
MNLSEVCMLFSIDLINEGSFSALGLLSHRKPKVLVRLYDKNFISALLDNEEISCVITTSGLSNQIPKELGVATCEDPDSVFYELHKYLEKSTDFYWSSFETKIDDSVFVHESAHIDKKNVIIGKNTIIEPNATILERSVIGDNCIIRAGCVIGGCGFEPKNVSGRHIVIPHTGGVRIGNNVEIQSNSHVARSVYGGFTEIGEGTKIDGMVHISHNVMIGRNCEIAANAMIAGTVEIGDNVWIGPSSSISSEIRIGDNAYVTIGSTVTKNVAANQRVTGNFAIDHSKYIAFMKSIR